MVVLYPTTHTGARKVMVLYPKTHTEDSAREEMQGDGWGDRGKTLKGWGQRGLDLVTNNL